MMNEYNVQIIRKLSDGNDFKINPLTLSQNVSVVQNNEKIPSSATDVQKVFDNLGSLSFVDTEIYDDETTQDKTWSSDKINTQLAELNLELSNKIAKLEKAIRILSEIKVTNSGTLLYSSVYGDIVDGVVDMPKDYFEVEDHTLVIKDETAE